MIKIGFIDYYLDEWHANNYPDFIKRVCGDEMKVCYAFGLIDSPQGGLSSEEWCKKYNVSKCNTIEEVVSQSDVLIVLSPDNCEMHEQLCQIPLKSGKPCYVDKTFAPDLATAKRIFAIAEDNSTPCYSASALRFADEYKNIKTDDITAINSWGPNGFETYSIHQLEPIVMLMKTPAKRVMYVPADGVYQLVIEFNDGRVATVSGYAVGSPFMMNIAHKDTAEIVTAESDYFNNFIIELVDFFKTGKIKVSHKDTLSIMAIRGAGIEASEKPFTWVNVGSID